MLEEVEHNPPTPPAVSIGRLLCTSVPAMVTANAVKCRWNNCVTAGRSVDICSTDRRTTEHRIIPFKNLTLPNLST